MHLSDDLISPVLDTLQRHALYSLLPRTPHPFISQSQDLRLIFFSPAYRCDGDDINGLLDRMAKWGQRRSQTAAKTIPLVANGRLVPQHTQATYAWSRFHILVTQTPISVCARPARV